MTPRSWAKRRKWGAVAYAAAQKPEGEITEVGYMDPKPGTDNTPATKESFITRVGDLGCGVGYCNKTAQS